VHLQGEEGRAGKKLAQAKKIKASETKPIRRRKRGGRRTKVGKQNSRPMTKASRRIGGWKYAIETSPPTLGAVGTLTPRAVRNQEGKDKRPSSKKNEAEVKVPAQLEQKQQKDGGERNELG